MTRHNAFQGILWVLVVCPIFLSGELVNATLPFILFALFLGLYMMIREGNYVSFTRLAILFGIFALSTIALLPFSLSWIASLPIVFWWIGFFCLFVYGQVAISTEKELIRLAKIFVLAATVFGLDAVYWFIAIGLTGYPRLNSVIGLHNIYGGFLILPTLLGLYLSLYVNWTHSGKLIVRSGRFEKILWSVLTAFLLSNMVLTVSRGTWLSMMVGIAACIILFRKEFGAFWSKKPLLLGIYILCGTVLFTGGIWLLAKHTATVETNSSIPIPNSSVNPTLFPQETGDENSVTSRLYYFGDALRTAFVSPKRLLVGFGSGNYADALTLYKTNPVFYSADPHDIFLKILVENGLFLMLVFISFIIFLFWNLYVMLRKIGRSRSIPPIYLTVFAGLVGMFVHACMDIDWRSPLLPIVFFLFSGVLYGLVRSEYDKLSDVPSVTSSFSSFLIKIMLVIILAGGIVSLELFRALNASDLGDYFYSMQQYSQALSSYDTAVSLNPYDSTNWYGRSNVEMAMGNTTNAKSDLLQAIALYPTKGSYYGALSDVAAAEKNIPLYEYALAQSIIYSPTNDLGYYSALVALYIKNKQYDQAFALIDRVLPLYSAYSKTVWFSGDPNAQSIRLNLAILAAYKTSIEKTTNAPAVSQ